MTEQKVAAPALYPVLRYQDGRSAIDWLVRVFAFKSDVEVPGAADNIVHAELTMGRGKLMLSAGRQPDLANPWSTERAGVYVAVTDVDAHCARAREGGATILMPLANTSYGARQYTVRDLEGHLWSFGTYQP